MRPSRSSILTAVLACISACAIEPEPDSADFDDPEEESLPDTTDESSAKPGCGPQPNHWCETFDVHAEYPNPGPYGTEIGYIGCINRADADLLTTCQQNGGLGQGCCGGNQPNPSNHDHPYAEWYGETWHCSGRMKLWRPCHPGSGIPECEPACN